MRRLFHPVLIWIAPLFLERKQVFESKNTLREIDAPDKEPFLTKEPVIWYPNHGFKDDVVAILLASRYAYILLAAFLRILIPLMELAHGLTVLLCVTGKSRQANMLRYRALYGCWKWART